MLTIPLLNWKNGFRTVAFTTVLLLMIYCIVRGIIPHWQLLSVAIFILALGARTTRRTALDWAPVFVYFLAYSLTRGLVFLFIKYNTIPVHRTTLLEWEKALFGEQIPTLVFQRFAGVKPGLIDAIALFLYSSFFWGTMLAAFVIWLKSREQFQKFINAFIILCFFGLITYTLFPAFPPWKAAEVGILPPLNRPMWSGAAGVWMTGFFSNLSYNPYAPMPSLHTAWAVLTSFALDRFMTRKWRGWSNLFYLYPVGIILTVIYSGDHYVVDVLGGILYAYAAILLVYRNKAIPAFLKKTSK